MDRILEALRAAAEPTRLRLLALLDSGELTVGEIVQILGQSQPRVSRHLKILADAGLLERFREGSWVFYRQAQIGDGQDLAGRLIDMIPTDDPARAQDRLRLEDVREDRAGQAAKYFRKNAAEWDTMTALNIDEDAVLDAIAALLPMQDVDGLLDLGTGTGRLLTRFGAEAQHATGVDRSPEMLQVARANVQAAGLKNVTLRQSDILSLPFGDASFDVVTCHQVLHFLDAPARMLDEAARVMSPGGCLLVADLAPHEVEDLRTRHAHRRLGFADEEVSGWAAAAGLKTQDVVHLSGAPLSVTLWLLDKPIDDKGPV